MNKKKAIVFVEPISTIWRVISATAKRGYLPIIVFTNYDIYKENEVYEKLALRNKTCKEMEKDFAKIAKVIYQPKKYEELISKLSAFEICGILKGSDGGVKLGEQLSKTYGFKSNNNKFFDWALDKKIVNDVLAKNKIRSISTVVATQTTDLEALIKKVKQYPVFIKPKQGAGGVNSFAAYDKDMLATYLKQILSIKEHNVPLYDEILVQELIGGDEYVVNTFSEDGEHYVVEVWKYVKTFTHGGSSIYRQTMLLKGNSIAKESVAKYAIDVLDALDFKNGPCHMEVKLDPQGAVLIECNWRIMGGSQFYDTDITMGESTGEFYLDTVLDPNYCKNNIKNKFVEYHSYAEVLDIMPQVHGKIKRINVPYILKKLKSYYTSVIFVNKGDTVIPATSIDEDLGNIQLRHKDYEVLKKDVDLFMEIEDHCLELLFEFEKPFMKRTTLPINSTPEIKVLEKFIGRNSVAIYSKQKVFNFEHMLKIKSLSTIPLTKYIVIDTSDITTDIIKAYDWIDKLDKNVKKGTVVIFTNFSINNAPIGFKYLMFLNNFDLLLPSHSHLIDDFSFWTKK
ncbi:MAG: hypothetical protein Ta2E_04110 [Mycoplasmoidaceae bacterium]|nr:MAG: hypothetical protein Ta2E_04110 [Mycoplasmoidaceae bacterium]